MTNIDIAFEIERLLKFAEVNKIIGELDKVPCRNALMDLFVIEEPFEGEVPEECLQSPVPILDNMLDYAAKEGLLQDNTITYRDLFSAKIMGILMPRQSEVANKFWRTAEETDIQKAVDDFYKLSKLSNYIMTDRIAKNLYWLADTQYGRLEITINLSKPEKDPRDIAAARLLPQISYPKCLLCLENVGFAGSLNHPARQNHRVIPVKLNKEQWYFQFSPYVYYNEHCIVFYEKHVPMKISEKTFIRLFDFIRQFPHYFIGSNADLPIVGGSILNHEHFQGGRHVFPMEKAPVERHLIHRAYDNIKAGIVKWPLSVLRLSGSDKDDLVSISTDILSTWREYSDEEAGIFAYTEKDGQRIPHNTITPIARKNRAGEYEIDLVLRNNRTSDEYPEGIFHPHKELHHIKKENIGLIEVMGLAVLPGRLEAELKEIAGILCGRKSLEGALTDENHLLHKHAQWICKLVKVYGTSLSDSEAENLLKKEVGLIFSKVLEHAGVYKRDEKGLNAFMRFLVKAGFKSEE